MISRRFIVPFSICFIVIAIIGLVILKSHNQSSVKTIGIIIPMEHAALREIIEGFKTTIQAEYPHPVRFLIENAQGDANIQRAIIQQFLAQKADLLVPIGTPASQMALAMTKDQPIISIASLYTEAERLKREPRNITGIHDEIPAAHQMSFIRSLFPRLKKMTLIHSNSEKVFHDVAEITRLANVHGINLQKLTIQALPDLYSVSKAIASDSELIFILKDQILVSGITTLAQAADSLKIPLITSDEGSVNGGAASALGVREKELGVVGARLAIQVLNGTPIASMPMQDMQQLVVFINKTAATKQGLDAENVAKYAQNQNYLLIETTTKPSSSQ